MIGAEALSMRRVFVAAAVLAIVAVAVVLFVKRPKPRPESVDRPASSRVEVRRRWFPPPPEQAPQGPARFGGVGGRTVDPLGAPVSASVTLVRLVDRGPQALAVPCASSRDRVANDVAKRRLDAEPVAATESGPDGRFEFKALAPGLYAIAAETEHPSRRSATLPFDVRHSREPAGDVALHPLRSLEVTLPFGVSGATVLLHDAAGIVAERAVSGRGPHVFEGVAAEGLGLLAVTEAGVGVPVDVPDHAREARAFVPRRSAVEARVTQAGRRVAEVDVTLSYRDEPGPACVATTDASGVVRFPPVDVEQALLDVAVGASRARRGLGPGYDGAPVELCLDDRPSLSVRVRDDEGRAVEGAEVAIGLDATARTDGTGLAVLSPWRGGDSVRVTHPLHEPAYVEVPFGLRDAPALDVTLSRYLPVTCRVALPPGLDAADVSVRLEGNASEPVSLGDGRFVAEDVRRGATRCEVSSELDLFGVSAEFEHPQGPAGSVVDVTLSQEGASLEVRVVDPEGAPRPALTVELVPDGRREDGTAGVTRRSRVTDERGVARFRALPAGAWDVLVAGDDPRDPPRAEQSIELAAGERASRTLVAPDASSLEGRVRNADGSAAAFAEIRASTESRTVRSRSGEDGAFQLKVPRVPVVQVTASSGPVEAEAVQWHPGDGPVTLVLSAPARVAGRILRHDGAVPEQLSIDRRDVDAPGGRFTIEVAEDEGSLRFEAKDVPPLEVDLPDTLVAGKTLELGELRFAAARTLLVTARGSDGAVLEDVSVERLGGPGRFSAMTDSQGVATFETLPAGALRLRCSRPDRSSQVVDVPEGATEAACVLAGTGTLEVTLAPALARKPSEGLVIEVATLEGGDKDEVPGPDGKAEFTLGEGRYLVHARDAESEQLTPMVGVDVRAGARTVVTLAPFVEGGVVRAGGAPSRGALFLLLGAEPPPSSLAALFTMPQRLRLEEDGAFRHVPPGPAQLLSCRPERRANGADRATCLVTAFVATGSGEQVVPVVEGGPSVTVTLDELR